MKIRTDFVTNSSSSSFIIEKEGVTLKDVEKKLREIAEFYFQITDGTPDSLKTDDGTTLTPYESMFTDPSIYDGNPPFDKGSCDWIGRGHGLWERSKGKIIFESATDNSIPYHLNELLCYVFDARRIFRS